VRSLIRELAVRSQTASTPRVHCYWHLSLLERRTGSKYNQVSSSHSSPIIHNHHNQPTSSQIIIKRYPHTTHHPHPAIPDLDRIIKGIRKSTENDHTLSHLASSHPPSSRTGCSSTGWSCASKETRRLDIVDRGDYRGGQQCTGEQFGSCVSLALIGRGRVGVDD
jgi:hypothetical protein